MTDETLAAEQPNAGTEIPGEAAPVSSPAGSAPERSEAETRARTMGWVPREEFRGPSDQWRDADEFVRRGEEELPILRERNRDLSRRYAEIETRVARQEREFQERVARQEHMARIALTRQREQLEANYEAAKRAAAEVGDTGRYDQLARDQRVAVGRFDEEVYAAAQPRQRDGGHDLPPEVATEVNSWQRENPWFSADPVLNQFAQVVHMDLNRRSPGMSVKDNLAQVAKEVRERFPEKFGVRQRPTAVESGGGSSGGGGRRGRGVSDLPPEARRAAAAFVKDGTFKSEADYAKEYFAQEGV